MNSAQHFGEGTEGRFKLQSQPVILKLNLLSPDKKTVVTCTSVRSPIYGLQVLGILSPALYSMFTSCTGDI